MKAMRAVQRLQIFNVQRFAPVANRTYANMSFNHEPAALRAEWPKPSFDMAKMTELLDHDNLQMRKDMREFLKDPAFTPKYVLHDYSSALLNFSIKISIVHLCRASQPGGCMNSYWEWELSNWLPLPGTTSHLRRRGNWLWWDFRRYVMLDSFRFSTSETILTRSSLLMSSQPSLIQLWQQRWQCSSICLVSLLKHADLSAMPLSF